MEESGACIVCFISVTGAMMALKAFKMAIDTLTDHITGQGSH